jgi:monoamine oxidase
MQEIHDACAVNTSSNALFGFVGVPAHYRQQYDHTQIQQACVAQLIQLFGEKAGLYQNIYYKDWAQDPYVTSQSDIASQPAHPHFPITKHTEELIEKNIYLAGSEFSPTDAGYLEGAVCAVENVMKQLKDTSTIHNSNQSR